MIIFIFFINKKSVCSSSSSRVAVIKVAVTKVALTNTNQTSNILIDKNNSKNKKKNNHNDKSNNNKKNNNNNNKDKNKKRKKNKNGNTEANENKQSTFKCYYTNATSLNADKINELQLLVKNEKYDMIFITETWFDELSVPTLIGFNNFRKDRLGHGGGVCIYIRDGLDSIEIPDEQLKQILEGSQSEQLWRCIPQGNTFILVGCIYRPPPGPDKTKNLLIENEIIKSTFYAKKAIDKNQFQGLVLAGDFNYPYVEWDTDNVAHVKGSNNSPGSNYIKLLNDEFLTQNVFEPTFRQANGETKNVLDYVISDIPDRITELQIGPPLGNTAQAHLSITWKIKCNFHQVSKTNFKKFIFSKGNYAKLNKDISSTDWVSKLSNENTKKAYEIFTEEYKKLCESSIPKIIQKDIIRKAPWVTKEILNLSSSKKALWHKNQATRWKVSSLVKEYEEVRKSIKKKSKAATITFERILANDKKNPKLLYAYVNSRQKVSDSISALKNSNNLTTNNKKEIASILNDQFSSVFVNEPIQEILPEFSKRTNSELNDISITQPEITNHLLNLDKFKSCGYDNMFSYVLKSCANAWAVPLSIIFRKSLDSGEVPDAWLEANVTPLFKKKGSRLEAVNYRPISLTSVVCKIMEKIVKNAVMKFLDNHSLISKHQHGFRNKKSCTTNLLEAFDYATKILSDKDSLDILFIDFEKAFDKVPHRRLLYKLKNYGIKGKVLKWFEAFLSNRKQRVVLGEFMSQWSEIKSGVPQGSVIGPILFIIYINDLIDNMTNPCKMYADDTKILARIRKENEVLDTITMQEDIDKVVSWTNTWLMRLNIGKCKIMHIGKKNQKNNYKMNSYETNEPVPLEKTELERDLGILITSNLKFTAQSNKAASNGNKKLDMLKNTFRYRGASMWKKLYTSYVRPLLEFAIPVWNPYLKGDIDILERVQHRATKISPSLKNKNYDARCKYLNLTSLSVRRTRGDLIQKYKIENKLDEVNWSFKPPCGQPRGGHRGHFKRELVKSCDQRHNFFNNRIASIWNNLSNEITMATTVNSFKNKLDDNLSGNRPKLLQNAIYC